MQMKLGQQRKRLLWLVVAAIALFAAFYLHSVSAPGMAQTEPDLPAVEVPPLPPAPPPGDVLPPATAPTTPAGTTPSPGATPGTTAPGLPAPSLPPVLPPASAAPAATLEIRPVTDSDRRFEVGVIRGYTVTPLAGTVLVEAPDGSLAYTVVAQAQPNPPLGLTPGFDTDALTQVATTVFQRGEGFQPGAARPEAGGGIVLDWTGSLTIAGRSRPMNGVILVRPTPRRILLCLITATESGKDRVPSALSALASSLQPL